MLIIKKVIITIFLLTVLLVSGCNQSIPITCNKPYILVGTACCLDKNDNAICDKDEKEEKTEKIINLNNVSLGTETGETNKSIMSLVKTNEDVKVDIPKYSKETENRESSTTSTLEISKFIVTYIVDGDTIELNTGDRVRLICIDTPEKGEYYYTEAGDYLKGLVLNKEIELVKDTSETDHYGRLLRYVYIGETFVNYKLVENGYAKVYHYPPDTSKCDELEEAEEKAKANNLGIWNQKKKVTPATKSSSSSSSSYICSYNAYNCDDFSTHTEAQNVYQACGGLGNDVHDLDRDNDGSACETLP